MPGVTRPLRATAIAVLWTAAALSGPALSAAQEAVPAAQSARPRNAPAAGARAADTLVEARRLYNLGRYEAAIDAAASIGELSAVRPQALLILGRARLERFRQTSDEADLAQGREDLRLIDASRLDERDRLELLVGLGQSLYLDNEYRVAAEVFTSALDSATALGPHARDQLLDWWATSLDRHAQTRAVADRPAIYDRMVAQMEQELRRDAGAASASYWLAAGLRLRGDLDRAWDAAMAGWVRALMTPDRGAALRPDLDTLVRDGIAPDRARRATPAGQDIEPALSALLDEWEAFKKEW